MKEAYRKLPEALRKEIMFRACGSAFFLGLGILVLCCGRDILLFLPCLLFFVFAAGSGTVLFLRCVQGKFVHLTGKCIRFETTGFRKRIRSFYMAYETGVVKLPVKGRIRNLKEGDAVSVYIAEDAPVYEKEGVFFVGDYYALEINGKGQGRRGGIKKEKSI